MAELTPAQMQAAADQINGDGQDIADQAAKRAAGSPDVALAMLGVAAGRIIDSIEPERRAEVLRNWLESFE